jgi:AcrR family transcriptional regulator
VPRPKGARDGDYDEKREALLRRMSERLARRNGTRPSLRQLAEAADVTAPTLRHYFGGRDEMVAAVFAESRRLGDGFIRAAAEPRGDFGESVRDALDSVLQGMQRGPLGDLFAVGFIEGLMNDRLGPACLANVVDPAVDAITQRLEAHQARGEMRPGNARHAALALISPLLIACLHQTQMSGQAERPLDLPALIEDLAIGFLRTYGTSPPL